MPSTVALTIPMAVFIAVAWVFTRLGKEGVLSTARRERHGVRRLVGPVLGAAAVIAALTLVSVVAGEALADMQLVSPFVGMWMANAGLLVVVLFLVWRPDGAGGRSAEALAIGG